MSSCYEICNKKFNAWDPKRLFCKKGCDSDEDTIMKCKDETCGKVCIKEELGEDGNKLGQWSSFFGRAPTNPTDCFNACLYGCNHKPNEDEDD